MLVKCADCKRQDECEYARLCKTYDRLERFNKERECVHYIPKINPE